MFGEVAVPLLTSAFPSLIATYHWPPLSPLRLNWIVAFMPFAASALRLAGISLKISSGVMQTPPLLWMVGDFGPRIPRSCYLACQECVAGPHIHAEWAQCGTGPVRTESGRYDADRCL